MNKKELIDKIKDGYWPDWEPAPEAKQVISDVEKLYELKTDSIEYFKLKADVMHYLSMNCIEQLSRGKDAQGMLTRRIIENLFVDLFKKEKK